MQHIVLNLRKKNRIPMWEFFTKIFLHPNAHWVLNLKKVDFRAALAN